MPKFLKIWLVYKYFKRMEGMKYVFIKNRVIGCCLLLSSWLFLTCKSTQITSGKINVVAVDQLDQNLKKNEILFTTFSGKTKLNIVSKTFNQELTAQIDIQNEVFIGLSIRKLGIEGIRVLITPDSIQILDRLNQQYIALPFQKLNQLFPVMLDFLTLQNCIIGNSIFNSGSLYQGYAEDKYEMFIQNSSYKNTIWLYPSFHIMRLLVETIEEGQSLNLIYSDYQKVEKMDFSFERLIAFEANQNYEAQILFHDVSFNQPLSFLFTINPKYAKITE